MVIILPRLLISMDLFESLDSFVYDGTCQVPDTNLHIGCVVVSDILAMYSAIFAFIRSFIHSFYLFPNHTIGSKCREEWRRN